MGNYEHFEKGGACPPCFLMPCQVFPGLCFLHPALWGKSCFLVQALLIATRNTGITHCHQEGTGGIHCPWDKYLESCAPLVSLAFSRPFPFRSWAL